MYVGLDYHTKSSYISILDEDNKEVYSGRLESQSELPEFLKKMDAPKVLFEAGYGWPRLARMLEGSEVDLVMCHPEHNRRIATDRRKSDKRDAKNLAVYLKTGGYKAVYMPGADVRDQRQLARAQANLTHRCTSIKNQIQSLLSYAGIPKAGVSIFTRKSRHYLETVELPEHTRAVLDLSIEAYDQNVELLKHIKSMIVELNRTDPRAKLLKTVPGVGDIIARLLLAEIGDISRFPEDKSLACYAGLTQREHQSSETRRVMGITKEGSSFIRWAMVQAAWTAIRMDPALGEFFEKLKQKKNANVAICAVARKLVVATWHVLNKQVSYKAGRPVAMGKPAVARGKTAAVCS